MPRPRFEKAAPVKRKALLDAAAAEFAGHGYEGASLNRILVAAGLSKGSFYYYFDDKADLAAAVIARENADWLEYVESLPPPRTARDFWGEVERLNERALVRLRERADLVGRLAVAAAQHPDLVARLGPFIKEATARFADFYRRGQEIGAVRADLPVEALMAIIAATKQGVGQALLPRDRAPTVEELAEFARVNLDCHRRLVEPPAPKRRKR